VESLTKTRLGHTFAATAGLFFILSGVVFIPHVGIENDEALFAAPLYAPTSYEYAVPIGSSKLALMLMSYLGTLKTWLYAPLFQLFGTSLWALRIPALVCGAASIWLFYLLLRRTVGERAAWIGCSLLAGDSIYLLTTCFDWGPVAIQHLLIVGGLLLVVVSYQTGRLAPWIAGFFLLGLSLWDKAIAVWILSGCGIAAFLAFPRQVFDALRPRRIALAAGALLLGAAPLVIYNAATTFGTFRSTTARDWQSFPGKTRALAGTFDGSGMFGWLLAEDAQTDSPHPPSGIVQMASAKISAATGHPRHSLMLYALALALLLAPLARSNHRGAILFAAIALTVTWLEMGSTRNAGGSVHHTILLWPLPQLLIAVSLGAASHRLGRYGLPALAVLLAVVAGSEVLVTNEYYVKTFRNGPAGGWTDAILPLRDYLKDTPAVKIECLDWGIVEPLRLLGRGTFPLENGGDLVRGNRETAVAALANPAVLWVDHSLATEVFADGRRNALALAEETGYRFERVQTIADTHGRLAFEVFRGVPIQPRSPQTPGPVPEDRLADGRSGSPR
jgi:4-amino-4-deoxy-L-arabinose transferase-like glycosyltransferase